MRFEFKHFAFLSADSVWAAEASLCAADQGQFWPYHDTLYANPNSFSQASLKRYAETLGLDTDRFDQCMDEGKYSQEVADSLTEGRSKGVDSTPTVLINGRSVNGAQPFEVFQAIIEEELAKADS